MSETTHEPFVHDFANLWGATSAHGPRRSFAEGGVHIVFTDPYFEQVAQESGGRDPGTIFKLNRALLIKGNNGSPEDARVAMEARATRETFRWQRMRRYFSASMVPQETDVKGLWYTKEQVRSLWGGLTPPRDEGIFYTLVTAQDKVPELLTGNFRSLTIPYAEWRNPPASVDTYSRSTDRWVRHANDLTPPTLHEVDDFVDVQRSEKLDTLLEHTARPSDPALPAAKKFVADAVQYTTDTFEIVDISGQDNVIFTYDGQCRIVDGLYPDDLPIITLARDALQKVEATQGLRAFEWNALLNGLGYVRTINFLAALYGVPARINLLDGTAVTPAVWPRVYNKLITMLRWKQLLATTAIGSVSSGHALRLQTDGATC